MKAAVTKTLFLAAAAAAIWPAAPAAAQDRVARLVIYGNDPCPRDESEIVVCARRPERERYRIPKELRGAGDPNDPKNQSWGARAESLEYAGRTGIQSCSTVGPGGFTGCWNEIVRAARGDRRKGDGEAGR